MRVCSLLLTLDPSLSRQASVVEALQLAPGVCVGTRAGIYLPVVTETCAPGEERRLFRWLQDLIGIQHVSLVNVFWDSATTEPRRVDVTDPCTEASSS